MKSFKSIREGNSVEPGVSEIDDVQDDPLSFVEIKPKKSKVVKGDLKEAVSVKKEKHSWGTMMTVHHGSDTSYPLHPEHQSAIKKLRPGMKTTFKDETNSTVHAHREDNTIHLSRPKTGSTVTALPYHHFDTSEHAKPAAKKPAGEYDRKVTDHLKKKYNEEAIIEAHQTIHFTTDSKSYKANQQKVTDINTSLRQAHSDKISMASGSAITANGIVRVKDKSHIDAIKAHIEKSGGKIMTAKAFPGGKGGGTLAREVKEETEQMNELKKTTLGSYIKKASDSATMSAYDAGGESQRYGGEPVSKRPDTYGAYRKVALKRLAGIGKATDRLTKEETDQGVAEGFDDRIVNLKAAIQGETPRSVPGEDHEEQYARHAAKIAKYRADLKKLVAQKKQSMAEKNMVETKGAPKGFHFTKDGKLKRGDANQDGNGGAMLRADPLDKQRNKVPAVSEKVEQIDELKATTVARYQDKAFNKFMSGDNKRAQGLVRASKKQAGALHHVATTTEEKEQMDEKVTSKDIKMAVGVAKDKRYAGGNMTGAVKAMEKMKPGLSKHPRVQQVLKSTNEGIDFLKIWDNIKPVHEEVKTTHEDPLVLTKDAEGNIHTHANLSVANAIHGTDVKHQAIHTGKPVQAGKFTFELSKHHEGALKEDAPFDPVAHKKELDRLMGKHIEAHKAVSKAFADAKAKGKEPSFDIPENQKLNDIKKEIAAHKGKVPSGPAPRPGSAAHYYASKKPGEYTGD